MQIYEHIGELVSAAVLGKTVFLAVPDSSRFHTALVVLDSYRSDIKKWIVDHDGLDILESTRINEFRFKHTHGRIILGIGYYDSEPWRRGVSWDGGMFV